jgi:hypothetical protein
MSHLAVQSRTRFESAISPIRNSPFNSQDFTLARRLFSSKADLAGKFTANTKRVVCSKEKTDEN